MMRRDEVLRRLVTLIALLSCAAMWPGIRAGEMEPPGPPGPTMKPLNEIETRLPIYAGMLPLTITERGVYYLAEDITATGAGIIVDSSHVTIDLNGRTLAGGTGNGITALAGRLFVTVMNGRVEYWGQHGVDLGERAAVIGVVATSNTGNGIQVENDSRVIDCLAHGNVGHGIHARSGSLVRGCQASYNQENGIWIDHAKVIDSAASNNDKNGIRVDHYSSVTGCQANLNDFTQTTGKAGIWVSGNGNRVEGNHLAYNGIGIDLDGNNNVVLRNTIIDSLGAPLDLDPAATGNLVETATSLSAAGPWSNLVR